MANANNEVELPERLPPGTIEKLLVPETLFGIAEPVFAGSGITVTPVGFVSRTLSWILVAPPEMGGIDTITHTLLVPDYESHLLTLNHPVIATGVRLPI